MKFGNAGLDLEKQSLTQPRLTKTVSAPVRPAPAQDYGTVGETSPGLLQRSFTFTDNARLPIVPASRSEIRSGLRRMGTFTDQLMRDFSRTLSDPAKHQYVAVDTQEAKFICLICCSDYPESESCVLAKCGREAHAACRTCMTHHLSSRIEDGRVHALSCLWASGDDGCGAEATEEELKQMLPEDTFKKCMLLREKRADPELRECPKCQKLCAPSHSPNGAVIAEMTCPDCACQFCYYHSNAHAPGQKACDEYGRAQVQEVVKDAKKCPKCKILTQKNEGCNHMTCAHCHADWCWICGEAIDNVGWHYNPANPLHCHQFGEDPPPQDCLMIFFKILSVPIVLVTLLLFLLSVALLLVTFPFALIAALICGCPFGEVAVKRVLTIWLCLIAIPIGLIFVVCYAVHLILTLLLCCCCVPCGVTARHTQFLLGVPMMTLLATVECAHHCCPNMANRGG